MRGALLATTVFAVVTIALLGALPLWLDEILQLIETRDTPTVQMIAGLPRNSGAVPLGYLAQKASLKITGYSVRMARVPAALFGIATVFAVALLADALGVTYVWLAAAMFGILPEALRYATEGRVYSQALFFSVVATLLYVRLTKEPSAGRAAAYCLALLATIYTQPYAASVAIAHLLWSIRYREISVLRFGAAAVAITVAAFLPWYLWSRAGWAAGIALEGFRFAVSWKTPLLIFREVAGAGYWGSGLLAVLCLLAATSPKPAGRTNTLLLLLIAAPVASIFAADAVGNYFLASRQFMWILPAVAILAAKAFESHSRFATCLTTALAIVCIVQDARFYRSPHDNWGTAAAYIRGEVQNGACLAVEPPKEARIYAFFQPELKSAACSTSTSPEIVLAIPPTTAEDRRNSAIEARVAEGYLVGAEPTVGGSTVTLLKRSQDRSQ